MHDSVKPYSLQSILEYDRKRHQGKYDRSLLEITLKTSKLHDLFILFTIDLHLASDWLKDGASFAGKCREKPMLF